VRAGHLLGQNKEIAEAADRKKDKMAEQKLKESSFPAAAAELDTEKVAEVAVAAAGLAGARWHFAEGVSYSSPLGCCL
jgi:hypothetical protein